MDKVYVAGKFAAPHYAQSVSRSLKALGLETTFPWFETAIGLTTDRITDKYRRQCAYDDLGGVRECDVVVALLTDPDYRYNGTNKEIGAALALGKQVLVVSGSPEHTETLKHDVFFHHDSVRIFETTEGCFAYISESMKADRWL